MRTTKMMALDNSTKIIETIVKILKTVNTEMKHSQVSLGREPKKQISLHLDKDL